LFETAVHHFRLASEDVNEITHRSLIFVGLVFFLRGIMKLHTVFVQKD
jgi:hypothetical protein